MKKIFIFLMLVVAGVGLTSMIVTMKPEKIKLTKEKAEKIVEKFKAKKAMESENTSSAAVENGHYIYVIDTPQGEGIISINEAEAGLNGPGGDFEGFEYYGPGQQPWGQSQDESKCWARINGVWTNVTNMSGYGCGWVVPYTG